MAYWGFDDSLTDSVGSKVLTASGGDSYVTGKLRAKALQLTAGNTADTSDATVLGYLSGACSIQAWIKSVTVASQYFGFGDDIQLRYGIGTPGDIELVYDYNTTGGLCNSAQALADDTWFHFVVTSDGAAAPKLYCNGTFVDAGSDAVVLSSLATLFGVGSGISTATNVYDAHAIWNLELTAQNVTDLYNGGAGNSP